MWGEGEPGRRQIWGEEPGALEAPAQRCPPRPGVLGPPLPGGEHQEHVGRQGPRKGCPGKGSCGSATDNGAALAGDRSPQSPESDGTGRGERGTATRRAGLPGPRGHAPAQRGGTRAAADPDTRGAERSPAPRARGPAAAAPGGPCDPQPPEPDPPRGASLLPPLPPSLPPAARYPTAAALTSGCT